MVDWDKDFRYSKCHHERDYEFKKKNLNPEHLVSYMN
jgi:hypothetical protein